MLVLRHKRLFRKLQEKDSFKVLQVMITRDITSFGN
jgi:hypothetical protein